MTVSTIRVSQATSVMHNAFFEHIGPGTRAGLSSKFKQHGRRVLSDLHERKRDDGRDESNEKATAADHGIPVLPLHLIPLVHPPKHVLDARIDQASILAVSANEQGAAYRERESYSQNVHHCTHNHCDVASLPAFQLREQKEILRAVGEGNAGKGRK
eukprot:2705936-Rhodomonas_salina.1